MVIAILYILAGIILFRLAGRDSTKPSGEHVPALETAGRWMVAVTWPLWAVYVIGDTVYDWICYARNKS